MTPTELETLMHDSANDAVAVAKEEFGITLDFTPESLALVDDVLLSFLDKYRDKALEDNAVFTLCNVFGAYAGETLKRRVGGEWHYDNSNPEAPYVVLEVDSRSYAFAGICYERLVNDSQVSVKAYFDHALTQHQH
ncbi:hypothetical protein [Alteromonas sp. CYL-A6]|uniref:hypothetical protein n=1 Tax=Alteromonas nitratireducens TaxID=3390813 RepID=UPI0034A997BC